LPIAHCSFTIPLTRPLILLKQKEMMQKIISGVLGLFLIFLLASCSTKLRFSTSYVVPAAQGSVKYKKDKNGNYAVKAKLINLSDPERLQPSKRTYVVWMETNRNGVKNLGQLKSSSGLFSSTMKGSLSTVTSFRPDGFFITAEDYPDIQYPGQMVVLRTEPY